MIKDISLVLVLALVIAVLILLFKDGCPARREMFTMLPQANDNATRSIIFADDCRVNSSNLPDYLNTVKIDRNNRNYYFTTINRKVRVRIVDNAASGRSLCCAEPAKPTTGTTWGDVYAEVPSNMDPTRFEFEYNPYTGSLCPVKQTDCGIQALSGNAVTLATWDASLKNMKWVMVFEGPYRGCIVNHLYLTALENGGGSTGGNKVGAYDLSNDNNRKWTFEVVKWISGNQLFY